MSNIYDVVHDQLLRSQFVILKVLDLRLQFAALKGRFGTLYFKTHFQKVET